MSLEQKRKEMTIKYSPKIKRPTRTMAGRHKSFYHPTREVRCNISKVFVYSYNRVDNYASR